MAEPLLTQVRPAYFAADCGMSYAIRTSDGKFIIIDGNVGEYDEAEHLYALLRKQSLTNSEPVISAWFITHPHGDHFGCFVHFFDLFGDRVRIERVLYHFPSPGTFVDAGSDQTEFLRVIRQLHAEIITPRTGDVFLFGDARFEVLFCCEDLYPGPIKNINESSLVMTMTLGKYKTLWLGDLQRIGAEHICSHVDPAKLKCDILQVGHHGYYGGNDALHRAADPEILLWPCPDFWFHTVRLWSCNDFLIHSPRIRATFVAGQSETTLDMHAEIGPQDPYPDSEVQFDLEKKSLCALNWSCPTGGKTGYAPANLRFVDGGCVLSAGNALTLCHMIHRGMTAKAKKYTFFISGKLHHGELLGLMFAREQIMEWSDDGYFTLTPKDTFAYRLELDRTTGTATIYDGDQQLAEWSALPDAPCDILLVMKNAELFLDRVIYTAEPLT